MSVLRRLVQGLDPARVAALLATAGVIAWLWDTPLVYPLQVLVVVFHELSHALMAWATGGHVLRVDVGPRLVGVTVTAGGWHNLVASAGYLGSLAWGAAVVLGARFLPRSTPLAVSLGGVLVAVAFAWVRPVLGFGFAFTLATGVALIAAAWRAPEPLVRLLLQVIGVTSCMYAVHDIRGDVLAHPGHFSDAVKLARHTGVPALAWGWLWMLVALTVTAGLVLVSCQRDSRHPPIDGT